MVNNLFFKSHKITFIFGSARGGTTWLWSLLESHPEVKPFINQDNNLIPPMYTTSESGIYIKDPQNAKRIIKKFLKNNKEYRVIEKTPSHTFHWKSILNDFPNSKNIIIVRNPMAIVNSMIRSNMTAFEGYDIEKSLVSVKAYFECLTELVKLERYHLVSYENLLLNTALEFANVLDYLNLSKDSVEDIIYKNKNTSKINVKGAFRKGKADSYKTEFSEKELSFLQNQLKNEIEFFKLINN